MDNQQITPLLKNRFISIRKPSKCLRHSLGVVALVGFCCSANVSATTFTFDAGDDNSATISKTVDGITLTMDNPSPEDFDADGDGFCALGTGSICTISSFNLRFSSSVQLISYNVGYITNLDGNETIILTDGSSTSTENFPFVLGSKNFANQFTVAANQTISVTTSGNEFGDLIQWISLNVQEITAPATPVSANFSVGVGLALSLGALGGVAAGIRRRKLRISN